MNKFKIGKNKKGFTLIELILYLFISATVLLVVLSLLSLIIQGRVKNKSITEVEQQGQEIMGRIAQNVRNADGVAVPAPGETSSELELSMPDPARDPLIFDVQNGTIRMTEGDNDPLPLSNSRVTISDLTFTDMSPDHTPPSIQIEFILSHQNPEDREEYRYEKEFIGSATVREE